MIVDPADLRSLLRDQRLTPAVHNSPALPRCTGRRGRRRMQLLLHGAIQRAGHACDRPSRPRAAAGRDCWRGIGDRLQISFAAGRRSNASMIRCWEVHVASRASTAHDRASAARHRPRATRLMPSDPGASTSLGPIHATTTISHTTHNRARRRPAYIITFPISLVERGKF